MLKDCFVPPLGAERFTRISHKPFSESRNSEKHQLKLLNWERNRDSRFKVTRIVSKADKPCRLPLLTMERTFANRSLPQFERNPWLCCMNQREGLFPNSLLNLVAVHSPPLCGEILKPCAVGFYPTSKTVSIPRRRADGVVHLADFNAQYL